MTLIIGRGSESDPASIRLATKKNTFIPNERIDEERTPRELRAAREAARAVNPAATCRSLTATYNCMGMVFAARRTSISIEHLELIRREDAYRRVQDAAHVYPGDLVVYGTRDGKARHIGVIVEKRPNVDPNDSVYDICVLSQWGYDGEYLHDLQGVPPLYGDTIEFWTERRPEE